MSKINEHEMQLLKTLESKLVSKSMKKYQKYATYLSEDFFHQLFNNFLDEYSFETGLNAEIYYNLYVQNQVDKSLLENVKNGNIDLEIDLINQYMPLLNSIINKMKLGTVIIDREGILISALETYNGNKSFSLHLLDSIKKSINNDNNNVNKNVDKEKDDNTFDEKLKNFSYKYCKSELSYIDSLVVRFDLINSIEKEELKKYIHLKFGYYNEIIFNNEDISQILNVSFDTIDQMYVEVLNLLKNKINEYIDLIILCDFEPITKAKCYSRKINNS